MVDTLGPQGGGEVGASIGAIVGALAPLGEGEEQRRAWSTVVTLNKFCLIYARTHSRMLLVLLVAVS